LSDSVIILEKLELPGCLPSFTLSFFISPP